MLVKPEIPCYLRKSAPRASLDQILLGVKGHINTIGDLIHYLRHIMCNGQLRYIHSERTSEASFDMFKDVPNS